LLCSEGTPSASPAPHRQAAAWTMTLHYYEDEAVSRRHPAGGCMLDNAQTLSCCYFMRYFSYNRPTLN